MDSLNWLSSCLVDQFAGTRKEPRKCNCNKWCAKREWGRAKRLFGSDCVVKGVNFMVLSFLLLLKGLSAFKEVTRKNLHRLKAEVHSHPTPSQEGVKFNSIKKFRKTFLLLPLVERVPSRGLCVWNWFSGTFGVSCHRPTCKKCLMIHTLNNNTSDVSDWKKLS